MLLPFKLMHVTICVHLACTSQLQQSCKINHTAGPGSIKHSGTILAGSTVLHPHVQPSEPSH